jgi:hypothetical protein
MAESKLTHAHTPWALSIAQTSFLEVGKNSSNYLDLEASTMGSNYAIFQYFFGGEWMTPFYAIAQLSADKRRRLISNNRTVYRWVVNLPQDGYCAGMSTHVIKEWEWADDDDEVPMQQMTIHLHNSIALPVLKYLHEGEDGRWAGEEVIFPGTITRRKDLRGNPTLEFDHRCDGYVRASKNGKCVVIAETPDILKSVSDKVEVDWSNVVKPVALPPRKSERRVASNQVPVAQRKSERRIASY